MSRGPDYVPKYRKHKRSGKAIVTFSNGLGQRRDYLLGDYGSKESKAEYRRLLAEWLAANRHHLPGNGHQQVVPDLTLNEFLDRYWIHAQEYYRKADGTQTLDLKDIKMALRPQRYLYADTLARDFSPLGLEAVRKLMIEGYQHPKFGQQDGLARPTINKRIGRIKRVWKWGVAQELIPESTYRRLEAVEGLRAGKTTARETAPIKPVRRQFVEETLHYLRPQIAAMVQLQLHTSMRPGEVIMMRTVDLDTSGDVWTYRPGSDQGPHGQHKNAWRGHDRVIQIGPRGQQVLRPWLRLNTTEYLFQPRESREEQDRLRRENRQSPMTPSQRARRRKRRPKRQARDHYTVDTYGRAIARACLAAGVPHWAANQLRHTKATEIRRARDLDTARATLGHRSAGITAVYAELDHEKAREAMRELG